MISKIKLKKHRKKQIQTIKQRNTSDDRKNQYLV